MFGHFSKDVAPTQVMDTPFCRLMLHHYGLWNYLDQSHKNYTNTIDDNAINDGILGHCKLQIHSNMHKNDPCYNIQLKEYQCVADSQSQEDSAKKCVKWYNEWIQCKWDHEKMIRGYNYIEPRPERKHKAYIAAPNYQYS